MVSQLVAGDPDQPGPWIRPAIERRPAPQRLGELTVEADAGAWREPDERESLLANLRRLPAMQRAALILHYADGLPIRAVAVELGRSEAATESLLTRGRDALRAAYEEAGR